MGDDTARQPYCHTNSCTSFCSPKGEMLSVFFFLCFSCLVRCLLSFFAVLLFLGSFFEKIFGSELLFLGGCVGLVFFGGFLLCFCFIFGVSLPKLFGKILLMSGLDFFWVRSLFLRFFFVVVVVFVFFSFFFKRYRSGSNRTPRHTHLFFWFFFFFASRRFCLFRPFWPCVPLLGVFSGVPFWAPGGFGILLELMGLELVRSPLPRPFSWDARRQGFSCSSSALFFFPLFVLRPHFSRKPE